MARSNDTDDKNESIQGLFDANPQMIGGYSVIALKALYLALFDRRTSRRLHVMKRSMRNSGHKNWGGMKK